ncbi:uncharacterized protein TNCV_827521 [Trichonephila clavipes]|nr:uncharacterized protein TNCV_827521 [Trichonephila clavipes]
MTGGWHVLNSNLYSTAEESPCRGVRCSLKMSRQRLPVGMGFPRSTSRYKPPSTRETSLDETAGPSRHRPTAPEITQQRSTTETTEERPCDLKRRLMHVKSIEARCPVGVVASLKRTTLTMGKEPEVLVDLFKRELCSPEAPMYILERSWNDFPDFMDSMALAVLGYGGGSNTSQGTTHCRKELFNGGLPWKDESVLQCPRRRHILNACNGSSFVPSRRISFSLRNIVLIAEELMLHGISYSYLVSFSDRSDQLPPVTSSCTATTLVQSTLVASVVRFPVVIIAGLCAVQ